MMAGTMMRTFPPRPIAPASCSAQKHTPWQWSSCQLAIALITGGLLCGRLYPLSSYLKYDLYLLLTKLETSGVQHPPYCFLLVATTLPQPLQLESFVP